MGEVMAEVFPHLKGILEFGVLGVLLIVLIMVIAGGIFLYLRGHSAHEHRVDTMQQDHRAEVREMLQTHISERDRQNQQHLDAECKLAEAIRTLGDRVDRNTDATRELSHQLGKAMKE